MRRYLSYSEADFEVFRPAGATRCTDGVKTGMEEGDLLDATFHPVGLPVIISKKTRMWADAQRDGRPVECRWRPL